MKAYTPGRDRAERGDLTGCGRPHSGRCRGSGWATWRRGSSPGRWRQRWRRPFGRYRRPAGRCERRARSWPGRLATWVEVSPFAWRGAGHRPGLVVAAHRSPTRRPRPRHRQCAPAEPTTRRSAFRLHAETQWRRSLRSTTTRCDPTPPPARRPRTGSGEQRPLQFGEFSATARTLGEMRFDGDGFAAFGTASIE